MAYRTLNFHNWHVQTKILGEDGDKFINILPKLHPDTKILIGACIAHPEPIGRLIIKIEGLTDKHITLKHFLMNLPSFGIKECELNLRFGLTLFNIDNLDSNFNMKGTFHFSIGPAIQESKLLNDLFKEKPPKYSRINHLDI